MPSTKRRSSNTSAVIVVSSDEEQEEAAPSGRPAPGAPFGRPAAAARRGRSASKGQRRTPRVNLLKPARTVRQRAGSGGSAAGRARRQAAGPGSRAGASESVAGPSADAGPSRPQSAAEPVSVPDFDNLVDLTGQSDDEEVVITSGTIPRVRPDSLLLSALHSAASMAQQVGKRLGTTPGLAYADPPSPLPQKPCAVCLDELKEPACGPCGHVFCKACLQQVARQMKKCPTCRKAIRPNQIHRIYF